VVAGEVTWIVLYGGAGYLCATQREAFSRLVAEVVGMLVGLALAIVAGHWLWRHRPHIGS